MQRFKEKIGFERSGKKEIRFQPGRGSINVHLKGCEASYCPGYWCKHHRPKRGGRDTSRKGRLCVGKDTVGRKDCGKKKKQARFPWRREPQQHNGNVVFFREKKVFFPQDARNGILTGTASTKTGLQLGEGNLLR